ncbi:MAG: response regulator [bacterium]|nr:response regulator [bacterium]
MDTPQEGRQKKILIVEDDTFLMSLLARKLSSKGYKLSIAKDGLQALEVTKNEKPDTILLDILLPHMNGFEVLEKLKASDDTKNIQVIMLSNLGQQTDIDKALKLGASQFLVKANTTPDEIVTKIEGIL